MEAIDDLRNILISKLLSINDKDVLDKVDKLINVSSKNEKINLTEEQILLLKMSEEDIAKGNYKSQDEFFKKELEWLNTK